MAGNVTFGGGDLLKEVGGVLAHRALKAQAPEEGDGLIHGPMEAHLPAQAQALLGVCWSHEQSGWRQEACATRCYTWSIFCQQQP